MQVIEPKKVSKKRKRRSKKLSILLLFIVIVTVSFIAYWQFYSAKKVGAPSVNQTSASHTPDAPKKGVLKTFTGEQFKALYNSIAYPNTQEISEESPITGNPASDAHIRKLALAKGYLPRSAPVTDTFVDVGSGFKLQERAATPWLEMKAAAKNAGLRFGLPAAYRSAEDQKVIFLGRLSAQGINTERIPTGIYDAQINQVLRTTAVPGYSRHHTGYTIDIACDSNPVNFDKSTCFKWLSANNYENAKKFGWIPSYPDGAGQQGPDPEPWEYVWVGTDALTE